MTQNEVKLTPEQESIIIKGILKFVDDNKAIPGSKQLFEAMDKKVPKAEITEFIKKKDNVYCNPKYAELMEIRGKYNDKNFDTKDWKFSEFYDWFVSVDKCEYCGTTKEILNALFKCKDKDKAGKTEQEKEAYYEREQKIKPLFSKKVSFTSALQIDRIIPDETKNDGYYKGNCALICVFCNNAKSDMVKSGDEFKNAFREAIGDYLRKKYDEIKDK